ncbi:MAG: hypothetical protein JEZ14_23840 [Marinilabiliaceae bacterium]|nr:hypothetical protein [Marinilabiliaceae bacterium]
MKMIWEGKGVPWMKSQFSKSYSFKKVKRSGKLEAVSWHEHTVFSLPLLLALRRNGVSAEEILSETLSTTIVKKDLVILTFGKYAHQDKLHGKIVNEDYPWRLFFNDNKELISAFIVCELNQQNYAINVLQNYITDNIGISDIESFSYSFHLKEKMVELLSEKETSSFSLWMDKAFQKQLETIEELPDIIDHCFDEIKVTGLSALSYHQLFRWFGEDVQQVGYNAFDYYVRSRNGRKAWEDALKDYLETYNFRNEISDDIFQNYIIPLLKF